ncbi:glutaredoxin family protein [Ferrimonas pelagia]|uniref:glutaredoxin family protein n=1 Tax=Ferrimonas pelagia TaxID=1177826 RepID=UPI0031EDED60
MQLFHTEGCHLCEQAEGLLQSIQVAYEATEICAQPEWVERYGIRIPVIRRPDGQELGWPFDLSQLKAFLEEAV